MRPLRKPPPRPTAQVVHMAAPIGGLNTIAAGDSVPEGDCISLVNMVAGENGLRVRLGYTQHAAGMVGAVDADDDGVRSLIPFHGSTAEKDRLFAFTSSGVYDASVKNAATLLATFGTPDARSGYATGHAFTTAAGNFLLMCDEQQGYLVYSESDGSLAQVTEGGGATQISGVNPLNLVFVTVWKSRVWFVERDSTNLWYLAAGSIYGTATKLPLAQAAQFRNGGPVIGLWSWTVDGGSGLDDYLVVATAGGDLAIFQGTDPASASTFSLKGTWNAGGFVAGRRIASSFGGDLLLLTKSGIRPLSQLVSGGDGQGTYATAKIANLFNALATSRGDRLGWSIAVHPEENSLIVTLPTNPSPVGTGASDAYEVLVQQLWNRSWSLYRGLDMTHTCVWRRQLHFGRPHGTTAINTGYTDNEEVIHWALLTPFRNGNGRLKKVEWVRPHVITEGSATNYTAAVRYGYNDTELAEQTILSASGNTFDATTWDSGTFQDYPLSKQKVCGGAGVGTDFAVAIQGVSNTKTSLVGIDVVLQQGGLL